MKNFSNFQKLFRHKIKKYDIIFLEREENKNMNIYNRNEKFKVNESGVISQVQRNALKRILQEQAAPELSRIFDAEIIETADGLIILLPNDEEGTIPVQFDLKIKNVNYDYETARQDYLDKVAEKEAKAKKKAEESEKRKNAKKDTK